MGSSIKNAAKPIRRGKRRSVLRRPILFCVALILAGAWVGFFAVTDRAPTVHLQASPSAEEVVAARDAFYQLASSQSPNGNKKIILKAEHLAGITALANQGFAPDRFDVYAADGTLYIAISHLLKIGRWVNLDVALPQSNNGFPKARLKIGSLIFSPLLSRVFLEITSRVLHHSGVVDVPQLDVLVENLAIKDKVVYATVQTGDLLDRLASGNEQFDSVLTLKKYCDLSRRQVLDQSSSLAIQVRRAFPANAAQNATVNANRASLISLAMFVVDKRLGRLVNLSDADVEKCPSSAVPIVIHNRTDLPKHLALSAAIEARMGVQLAEAMGEWKELADSLSKRSQFQSGDPTGFSFVDLAADRSGFRIARAATSDVGANDMARRLARATESTLLPEALLTFADGMRGEDFESAYGGISDPRFSQAVASIDSVLDEHSLLKGNVAAVGGPLH